MRVAVIVTSVPLEMELDTRPSVSTISEKNFMQLFPSAVLEPSDVQLRSFSGVTRPVAGKYLSSVKLGEEETQLPLFEVKERCPTLSGRSWMREFQFGISKPEFICSVSSAEEAAARFQEVFSEGLGTFRGVKAGIMVPQDATPRFFKPLWMPFALEDKF